MKVRLLLASLFAAIVLSSGAKAESVGQSSLNTPNLTVFTQTTGVTITNTVAETSILGAGVGSLVIPANYLRVGRSYKIWMIGRRSATGNPSERLQLKLNGVTVLDTGTATSGSATNEVWECRAVLTVRSTGLTGTGAANGFYMEQSGSGTNDIFGMINTAAIAIDTTIPQTMSATWTWGVASTSNSITSSNVMIEVQG